MKPLFFRVPSSPETWQNKKHDTCAWTPNKVFIEFLVVSVETARVLLQPTRPFWNAKRALSQKCLNCISESIPKCKRGTLKCKRGTLKSQLMSKSASFAFQNAPLAFRNRFRLGGHVFQFRGRPICNAEWYTKQQKISTETYKRRNAVIFCWETMLSNLRRTQKR